MNSVWTSVLAGFVTVAAAAAVAGGEIGNAELRFVEATTRAVSSELVQVLAVPASDQPTRAGELIRAGRTVAIDAMVPGAVPH